MAKATFWLTITSIVGIILAAIVFFITYKFWISVITFIVIFIIGMGLGYNTRCPKCGNLRALQVKETKCINETVENKSRLVTEEIKTSEPPGTSGGYTFVGSAPQQITYYVNEKITTKTYKDLITCRFCHDTTECIRKSISTEILRPPEGDLICFCCVGIIIIIVLGLVLLYLYL